MARDDGRDTGIPTRAIHEGYLGMQEAHRNYRQSRDSHATDERQAQRDFQDSVLTFYELVRPHLKHEAGLAEYWHGELPPYLGRWWDDAEEARRYCRQEGTAVWALQKHTNTSASAPTVNGDVAVADGGQATPAEWHDRLNLTEMQRLVSIGKHEGMLLWIELRATAGLRQLDTWETGKQAKRKQGDGFMAGETATNVTYEYVAPWKLVQAKRLLVEVTDKLSLLSDVDFSEPIEAGGKYEDALNPDVSVEDLDNR